MKDEVWSWVNWLFMPFILFLQLVSNSLLLPKQVERLGSFEHAEDSVTSSLLPNISSLFRNNFQVWPKSKSCKIVVVYFRWLQATLSDSWKLIIFKFQKKLCQFLGYINLVGRSIISNWRHAEARGTELSFWNLQLFLWQTDRRTDGRTDELKVFWASYSI